MEERQIRSGKKFKEYFLEFLMIFIAVFLGLRSDVSHLTAILDINLVRLKQDAVHKGNHELFDGYVFSQMKISFDSINRSPTIIKAPAGHPALLSADYKTVNTVALNYYYLAATQKFGSRAAERQRKLELRLIELIKKEYPLD